MSTTRLEALRRLRLGAPIVVSIALFLAPWGAHATDTEEEGSPPGAEEQPAGDAEVQGIPAEATPPAEQEATPSHEPEATPPAEPETEAGAAGEASEPIDPECPCGEHPDALVDETIEDLSEEDVEAIMRALELDKPEEGAADLASPPPAPSSARRAPTGNSMNPELSFIANFALAAFSGEPRQTGAHDPTETGFNFQQLELAISSTVDTYFRFDANLVFSLFGVEIEEVYATTLALPHSLQARVGQFLTRAGRTNPTHPHQWLFEDQPLVLGKIFGGENNRGLGVELSWLSPLPWYLEAVWSITDGRGASTARSFWGANAISPESPLDLQNLLAIRQFFALSHDWSLMLGLTGITGPNPTGPRNRTDIFGADLYLRWRPISRSQGHRHVIFQAEAWNRRRQLPGDLLVDFGGYAHLVWRFAVRWETGIRSELVTGTADDPLDPEWTGARHRHSAMLTYRPTEFSRLRLQAARDDADWLDRPTHSVFLAAEFSVGAHAAHPF